MAEEAFHLPGSSYTELVKIIQAYAKVKADALLPEVSKVIGIHSTQISRSTGFLVDIGVLAGGQKKGITEAGRKLAQALELEMPDEIRQNWRRIVRPVDFLDKVLAAVRIRKGMDRSALQSHIVYSAGRSKTAPVLAGAVAVIDVLKAAELLRDEDGRLVVVPDPSIDGFAVDDIEPSSGAAPATTGYTAPTSTGRGIYEFSVSPGVPVSIQIQLQVQCTVDEIEMLGPKLRRLIESLSSAAEQPESTSSSE